jgi:predicted PurR-regulated permease PerM
MAEKFEISISWQSLWKVLAIAALVSVVYIARDILVAVILAIVIASALEPAVSWLEKRRIPRLIGTLAVYIIVLFVIALLLYIVVPVFLTQINAILENSQDIFGNVIESLGIQSTVLQTIISAINEFTNNLLGGQTSIASLLSQVLGGLLIALIIFGISFYLTIGRDGVERFLRAILPIESHGKTLRIYGRLRVKISHWFAGQVFLSVLIGVMVYLAMMLLGVKYAFLLAITAALFELVPFVGPIFAGGLAVLTALSQSTSLGIYTLIAFTAIQQLESNLIIPAVNKYTTNLNPVVVIVALLIGGKLLGVPGIIIAVPMAVLVQEIIKHAGHPDAEPQVHEITA